MGSGRGLLGAQEAAGYMPGEQVLVAVSPASPGFNAFIIGRADYSRAGAYTRTNNLLVYPQVAGFEPGKRFSGKAYEAFPRIRNFNSGIQDAVDGEWVMHNMFGGAVGVEMFRTFLQAGPMCGVYAYTEDQHLKLVAARYSLLTLAGSQESDDIKGSNISVAKKYYFVGDQAAVWQAQEIDLSGVPFNGSHKIVTYPDGTNGTDSRVEGNGQSRVAMIHEHRGVDGNYILTAAASLTLQKSLFVPVPIDVIEADGYEVPEEGTTGCLNAQPLTPDPEVSDCASDDPNSCTRGPIVDNFSSAHPLAFAMNARGFADRTIWRALDGVTRLCRWKVGQKPNAVYGGRTNAQLLFNPDPGMWKNMPQTVRLSLAPTGEAKRFYVGHALISITEDGSIVLQEAQGAQIILSGGNIHLSAPHDIVTVAGRNTLQVAGRDMGVRASRHLDVSANEGRLTMMAAEQTSVVGGVSGHGGVLIESMGQHASVSTTGENPATSGAVVIKAPHMVGLSAPNLTLRARGNGWSGAENWGHVFLDVGSSVEIYAGDGSGEGNYSFGASFEAHVAGTSSLMFGSKGLMVAANLWVQKSLFYNKQFYQDARDSGACYYRQDKMGSLLSAFQSGLTAFDTSPLAMGSEFTAKWLTSEQHNISSATSFQLPEPEWQIRAKAALPAKSSALNAKMVDNVVSGTVPFPGRSAWGGYALATGGYTQTADFGEEPVLSLTITTTAADGNLFKGL